MRIRRDLEKVNNPGIQQPGTSEHVREQVCIINTVYCMIEINKHTNAELLDS